MQISELGKTAYRFYGYVDAINQLPPHEPGIAQLVTYYHEGYAVGLADLQRIEETNIRGFKAL